MRLHVVLEPALGDGFLTEQDARLACPGLPGDAPVLPVLSDMESFPGSAAAWVGRRFAGTGYLVEARPSSAADFEDAVHRSEDVFQAGAAADLRRGVSQRGPGGRRRGWRCRCCDAAGWDDERSRGVERSVGTLGVS